MGAYWCKEIFAQEYISDLLMNFYVDPQSQAFPMNLQCYLSDIKVSAASEQLIELH